jgi:prepilin signal peptidase PulO-like enzyme (type II secretory pathway)
VLLLHFSVFAVLISVRDCATHRIRRVDTYLALVTIIPFIYWRSLVFGAVNFILFLAIRKFSQGGLGKGDLRLSPLMGIYISLFETELSGIFKLNLLTWISAGLCTLISMNLKEGSAIHRVPFAPFMFIGVAIYACLEMSVEKCALSAIIGRCVG